MAGCIWEWKKEVMLLGWYNYSLANIKYTKDPDNAKNKYNSLIKERLNYFKENPKEMAEF